MFDSATIDAGTSHQGSKSTTASRPVHRESVPNDAILAIQVLGDYLRNGPDDRLSVREVGAVLYDLGTQSAGGLLHRGSYYRDVLVRAGASRELLAQLEIFVDGSPSER